MIHNSVQISQVEQIWGFMKYNLDMKNSNFDNQTLEKKDFEGEKFINCSFIQTEFKKCKFISCKFVNCRISALKLTDSIFIETSFVDSKVEGVDWTKAIELRELAFENCDISYSNFNMLNLPNTKIINCIAKECAFSATNFTGSILTGTDFEGSRFFKTNLTKADFRDAKNYWIDIRDCNLKDAKFKSPEALNLLRATGVQVEV